MSYPFSAANEATYLTRVLGFLTDQKRQMGAMKAHSEECAREISKGGFEVLLAANCSIFASPFIGRYFSGPKVLYLQDPKRLYYEALGSLIWRAPDPFPERTPLRRKLIAKVRGEVSMRDARKQVDEEYENAAAFDEILVNSHFSREAILRSYGLDSRVCYLGIDSEMFGGAESPRGHYVIGLGAMHAPKRIEFVIDALATIESNRPKLVWIGQMFDTEYLSTLEERARAKGVECEFKIQVSDQELVQLLSGALAMVYAPRLEPFGFAPLEANACGTPAVCVAEGGIRESIKHGVNGLLVDPSPSAMGAAVSYLAANPDVARSLGQSALEHVRTEWTWDRSVDILEERLRVHSGGAHR